MLDDERQHAAIKALVPAKLFPPAHTETKPELLPHANDMTEVGTVPHQPQPETLPPGVDSVKVEKMEPYEEPDPWKDLSTIETKPKKEYSPFSTSEAGSMTSASTSSRVNVKRARSDSPLSDLSDLSSSDGESEEKLFLLGDRARKRMRRMRKVFIPLWELTPLVCKPVGTDLDIEDGERITDFEPLNDNGHVDMDGFGSWTPPRSLTPVRARSASVWEQTTVLPRHNITGASLEVQPKVEVEVINDDDDVITQDDPPLENVQYPRASEIDVKVKVEELDEVTANDRIQQAGAKQFIIEEDEVKAEELERTLHRYFLCHEFGGGNTGTYITIKFEKWQKHELNDWFFVPFDTHPSAPRYPGMPGLWFDSGHWTPADGDLDEKPKEEEWVKPDGTPMSNDEIREAEVAAGEVPENRSGIWRLCVGLGHCRTLYAGQYVRTRVADLTQQEWLDQKPNFRLAWAKYFKKHEWGQHIRYRVKYRLENFDEEPTRLESTNAMEGDDEFKDVTADQIKNDFDRGKEFLGVYVLNCVGFEKEFQQRVIAKNAEWEPGWQRDQEIKKAAQAAAKAEEKRAIAAGEIEDPRKNKKPRGKGSKSAHKNVKAEPEQVGSMPKPKPVRKAPGKGKKKQAAPLSEDKDEDYEAEELVYIPRKTKSRSKPVTIDLT